MARAARQHPPIIAASEVGEFVFCAKAWQLKRAGHEPDSAHLAAGTAFHHQHGNQLTFAHRLQRAAWVLVSVALLVLLVLLWRLG